MLPATVPRRLAWRTPGLGEALPHSNSNSNSNSNSGVPALQLQLQLGGPRTPTPTHGPPHSNSGALQLQLAGHVRASLHSNSGVPALQLAIFGAETPENRRVGVRKWPSWSGTGAKLEWSWSWSWSEQRPSPSPTPSRHADAEPGAPRNAKVAVCLGAAAPTTELAEGVGFEPTGLLTRRFSRPLHSAALPPFQRHNPSGTGDPTHSISVSA